MKIDASVFSELEKFMSAQTLKKAVLLNIAAQIPESEIENLRAIF